MSLGYRQPPRTTARAAIHEEFEYERETDRRIHRGYRWTSEIVVHLPEADRIGELMRRASEQTKVSIRGPSWRVARDNEAWTHARAEAAADAKRRAEAYARSLGARVGAISKSSSLERRRIATAYTELRSRGA